MFDKRYDFIEDNKFANKDWKGVISEEKREKSEDGDDSAFEIWGVAGPKASLDGILLSGRSSSRLPPGWMWLVREVDGGCLAFLPEPMVHAQIPIKFLPGGGRLCAAQCSLTHCIHNLCG